MVYTDVQFFESRVVNRAALEQIKIFIFGRVHNVAETADCMSVCVKYTGEFDLRFGLYTSQIQIVHQQIISVCHCKEIFNGIYAFECGDVVNATIPIVVFEITALRGVAIVGIAVFDAGDRNSFCEYSTAVHCHKIVTFINFEYSVAVFVVKTQVHTVARVFVFADCDRRVRNVDISINRILDFHAGVDCLIDFYAVYNVIHSVNCKLAKSRRGRHKFDNCAFDSIAANDRSFLSVDVNARKFDFCLICKINTQVEFFTKFDNIVVEQREIVHNNSVNKR